MTRTPESIPGEAIPSFRLIGPQLRQVRDRIYQSLAAPNAREELALFVGHLRAGSGRMIRAGLVLLAGRCCGPLAEQHLQVSAMVEMIYHAMLLHDRVLDENSPGRGLLPAEGLEGNEVSVLLGDFILSHVFRMAAHLESGAARVIAWIAAQLCEGELRQSLQRGNWELGEAQYLEIISCQNASFFGGCCRLGGLLAGADENRIEALSRFGFLTGLAGQITDELRDLADAEARPGGAAPRDGTGGKPTLAVLHLLQTVDPAGRARVRTMLESPGTSGGPLLEMLEQYGSLRYARARAAEYATQAVDAARGLPSGPAREALLETVCFLADSAA